MDGCAPLEPHAPAHQRNTPHAARCTPANIHAVPCLLFACETSVCLQIAKRAYLQAFRVIYKYIYIVTRKAKKIHIFCHSPHVRRLGRLKITRPPRIYTVPSTPPQHCHDAARTGTHRKDTREAHREKPSGCSEKERREIVRYKAL